jgi:hypothetical protein
MTQDTAERTNKCRSAARVPHRGRAQLQEYCLSTATGISIDVLAPSVSHNCAGSPAQIHASSWAYRLRRGMHLASHMSE